MQTILETLKNSGSLHHAYLITGDTSENLEKLRCTLEKIVGVNLSSHPDYYQHVTPSFSIADSRQLIERQKTKSFSHLQNGASEGMRFFVVVADSFTIEAQNGLLKVLEDPIASSHFFILTTRGDLLLPTLYSRLSHMEGDKLSYNSLEDWCNSFINRDVVGRLLMVEKFLKENEGDKLLRHKTRDIFNQIEKILSEKLVSDNMAQSKIQGLFLTLLINMKDYLNDVAPATRLILEYIAFSCPRADTTK